MTFRELIESKEIVVCVGSGGVGKTTTSAVIGLHAALQGKRVLVLTIDPARRLANSLGIDAISDEPAQIPLEQFQQVGLDPGDGELWAMMLDMKTSFDRVVRRHAPDEAREAILNNRIYQYFSTSLAGTQEYAAAERLFELHSEGEWDLIVLDTPPTTHALDFLEAPNRLEDAIDNKALQWIYKPGVLAGKRGLGIFSMGTSYVLKTLGRLTGTQLLEEFSVFLRSFSTLFEGLRDRAREVRDALAGDMATFVVVTAPDPLTLDEALEFHRKLGEEQVQVGAFVVNRVHGFWLSADELARPMVQHAARLADAHDYFAKMKADERRAITEKLLTTAREFDALARGDEASLDRLRLTISAVPIQTVPFFATDIHSIEGLDKVRRALIG
jgi:anion-transporting  ArsA/GET3 family ATPase